MLQEKLESNRSERPLCARWWHHVRNAFTRSLWLVVIWSVLSVAFKCCSRGKQDKGSSKKDKGSNDRTKDLSAMEAGCGNCLCWPCGGSPKSAPSSKRDFIYVQFNAWECAGSEVLWAALISKIFDKVRFRLVLEKLSKKFLSVASPDGRNAPALSANPR